MANGCPAVAVADGWVWITNWLAAAGLTTIALEFAGTQAAAGELERDGLGLVVGQAGERRHAAQTRVVVVVPWSGPAPLASAAVTTVLLSPVSRLPYWSSS